MAVSGQHQVDVELAQDRHHITGVAEVVDIAASARDGEDVMVDHNDPGPLRPTTELGVEPAVVLAPDLALVDVDVGLGGVDRHDLRAARRPPPS